MAKNTVVFGIYPHRESVEDGVAELQAAGFRNTDISVLLPESAGIRDFAHEKGTKAPEGLTAGATSGAVIGGSLGWLAGIGALAIPGLGPFIAAGPIMGALAGLGAGGAIGGVIGALIGFGIPEYEAKRYEGRLRKGGILISVHCDDSQWAKSASEILKRTGAEDISSTSESKADYPGSDRPSMRPVQRQDGGSSMLPPLGGTRTRQSQASQRPRGPVTVFDRAPEAVKSSKVASVMSKNIEMVDGDTALAEAAERMRRLDIGFLPVLSGGVMVGVVTDRDITVRASAEGVDPNQTKVSSAMTTDYAYCFDTQSLSDAATIMEQRQVRRLPVVDQQRRLVGVVSLADLAAKAGDEKLAGEVLRLVAAHRA